MKKCSRILDRNSMNFPSARRTKTLIEIRRKSGKIVTRLSK